MAKLAKASVGATLSVTLELSEVEACALYEMCGYNVDDFLKVFYEHLGKHYLKPYEAGVRSLHETVRPVLTDAMEKLKAAKEAIKGNT